MRSQIGFALCAILCLVPAFQSASADEIYAPKSFWLSLGFKAVSYQKANPKEHPTWQPHSFKWPVPFQDAEHSLGNSMAEFQDYGDGPYYHGGCDLRVQPEQTVTAPVSGKLEAGHYGYTNQADGSSTKYWYPWPSDGEEDYFEIAIVTDDGYRFEFHHINADKLPDHIVALLNQGGGRVQAGEVIGQAVIWPMGDYNHIHLNIYTPSGMQLNPEYYFEMIPDHVAPKIQGAFAVMADQTVVDFGNGQFSQTPTTFAIAVNDQKDNDTYVQPPVFAGVDFDSGQKYEWDFRERLSGPDGKFPPIWNFFMQQISGPSETYSTEGGYGTGLSVVQIPVPQGAHGPFTIRLADEAGNETRLTGRVN